MKYMLFPGCVIASRLPFVEKSAVAVLEKLGIEFLRSKEFGCCFDPIILKSLSRQAWLVMAARNLAIAEEHDANILTLCNGCFCSLNEANHVLRTYPELKENVNEVLGKINRKFNATAEVVHISKLLYDIGKKGELNAHLRTPLKNYVLFVHHGCHLTRPSDIANISPDTLRPQLLGSLADWLGAKTKHYPREELCCGSGLGYTEEKTSAAIFSTMMEFISASGANAILTSCPSCFIQFELKQGGAQKLPVFFVTELCGLAFSLEPEELGLKYHRIPVNDLGLKPEACDMTCAQRALGGRKGLYQGFAPPTPKGVGVREPEGVE